MDLAAQHVYKILRHLSFSDQPHIELRGHFSVVISIFLMWKFPRTELWRAGRPRLSKTSQLKQAAVLKCCSQVPCIVSVGVACEERRAFVELRPRESYL